MERQIRERQIRERDNLIRKSKFHRANRRIIAEVVKKISGGQGKILEIGCGHGDITREYIAPNCASVIATDIVKRFLGEEISSNIKFQLEDALSLSFPDETFDGVIAVEVIEHVEDDVRFIEESLRVLRKGGTLFFTTPNRLRLSSVMRCLIGKPIKYPHCYGHDPAIGDVLHLREYSLSELREFLKKFPTESVDVKGIWFGIPAFQIGITHPPKFLQRYAFTWHVKIIK